MLLIKRIFGPTIQGEGQTSGAPAIFIHFGGCNMWSGNKETRAASQCPFCDADFVDAEQMYPDDVIDKVKHIAGKRNYLIVMSGGEPLLQPANDMITLLTGLSVLGFETQLETNGTINKPRLFGMLDYVVCSPKVPLEKCSIDWQLVTSVMLLYPHPNKDITPDKVNHVLAMHNAMYVKKYLQPIDTQQHELNKFNTNAAEMKAIELGAEWRVSYQTQKLWGRRDY